MTIDELAEKLAGDIFDAEGEWPERLRPERVASWSRIIKKGLELAAEQSNREIANLRSLVKKSWECDHNNIDEVDRVLNLIRHAGISEKSPSPSASDGSTNR